MYTLSDKERIKTFRVKRYVRMENNNMIEIK